MTSTEFAEKIDRPYNTVIRWLRQGKVKGAISQPFGNITVWFVPKERVEDFEDWDPKKSQGKRGKAKESESKTSKKSSKKGENLSNKSRKS